MNFNGGVEIVKYSKLCQGYDFLITILGINLVKKISKTDRFMLLSYLFLKDSTHAIPMSFSAIIYIKKNEKM